MIPAKFGENPTMRFQEEDENVKSWRTTDDGRRTTDDGRKTDGNSSLEPSAQVS